MSIQKDKEYLLIFMEQKYKEIETLDTKINFK